MRGLRLLLVVGAVVVLSACSSRVRTAPGMGVHMPLREADFELLGWTEATACAKYIFGIRVPEEDPAEGKRIGVVSGGSVIGGGPPNQDAADALYLAMVQMPEATHVLVPKYMGQASGLGVKLRNPIFGRRCVQVRVRGIALKG